MLAQASTCNQVLDTWILFRYRQPKRMSHFMMALKRLVEVGGCEPTDWRLHVLLSRMRRGYKRVINPDILLEYMGSLNLYQEVERFTRFLKPRIHEMKPYQLIRVLHAFGNVHLRDPAVAGLCLRYLKRDFKTLSSADLTSIVRNLGALEIRNSNVYNQIASEISKRELSLQDQLSFLTASREARVRDYCLIERITASANKAIESGDRDNLILACSLCSELSLLGIPDEALLRKAFSAIQPLKLPISSVIKLTRAGLDIIEPERLKPFVDYLCESVVLLNKKWELVDVAIIGHSTGSVSVVQDIAQRLVAIRGRGCVYDVPRLANIFVQSGIESSKVWTCIVNDIKAGIIDFEPEDLLRTARLLHDIPADILGENRSVLANEVASWSLKRWEEFNPSQWTELNELVAGHTVSCSSWHREELIKWTPKISLPHSSNSVNVL